MQQSPARLITIPSPDRQAVDYNGTTVGEVRLIDDKWYYIDHHDEHSEGWFETPEEAGHALVQDYLEDQIRVLSDITHVVQTFTRTILDQPQPGHLEVLGQAKRLLSTLNERVTALGEHLDIEEAEEGDDDDDDDEVSSED